MALSGQDFLKIQTALLAGYKLFELRMMVRHGLNENLENITLGNTLSEKIFDLIDWAVRTDRLSDLITSAHQCNPGNSALKQLYDARIAPAEEPAPAARQPSAQYSSHDILLFS